MSTLEVKIPAVASSSYRIEIGNDMLGGILRELDDQFGDLGKFIITDVNIVSAGLLDKLTGGAEIDSYVIDPAGEVSKHMGSVTSIIETMEKLFFGRDTLIIALGGGTVGDIAGFAGAIFKRGVKVVQIPTTTVSQADSSVGGKTGVDSTVSKNAYGAFFQPSAVYIDVLTLSSLDERQYRAGLMESVKHALIADSGYFEFFEKNTQVILDRDIDILAEIAYKSCSIKAVVVGEDPTEQNKRRILNYGHTIGHAVESASGFDILHGEAVAIGMLAAGIIEQELGLSGGERLGRVEKVLSDLGMPAVIPAGLDKNVLIKILKYDKKAVNKCPKFVLLEEIGSVMCKNGQWAHEVSAEIVEKTIDKLLSR